ncbi:MAG: UDP-N-acetylglucosamine 2-epimerase [archaeon]
MVSLVSELDVPVKPVLPVLVNTELLKRECARARLVPLIVTSTKPDFYKQWPLLPAAGKAGLPRVVMNTGQHFDSLLGHGLDEFGIRENIGIDLRIKGNLSEKTSEVVAKLGVVSSFLSKEFPDNIFLPIVHGDTHAAGMVPLGWMFATNQMAAQNEAGLRAMQPDFANRKNLRKFVNDQFERKNWVLNRTEPFPEQYDTFIGGAACHYHFAPTELNKDNLVREGYFEGRVPVVGNSVVEALREKMGKKPECSIFGEYPRLEKGDWIRVDVHRRENMIGDRFKAIFGGIRRLVRSGRNVVFVEMNANKFAVEQAGLETELEKLKGCKNFLYTPLWREYGQVVEFLKSDFCVAELTDSGSMQEELNELKGPVCLTCRFSTDRPESVFSSGSNLLVPPISAEYVADLTEHILSSDSLVARMRKGRRLYGRFPSRKIMSFLKKRLDEVPFEWANERAGVSYRNSGGGRYFL